MTEEKEQDLSKNISNEERRGFRELNAQLAATLAQSSVGDTRGIEQKEADEHDWKPKEPIIICGNVESIEETDFCRFAWISMPVNVDGVTGPRRYWWPLPLVSESEFDAVVRSRSLQFEVRLCFGENDVEQPELDAWNSMVKYADDAMESSTVYSSGDELKKEVRRLHWDRFVEKTKASEDSPRVGKLDDEMKEEIIQKANEAVKDDYLALVQKLLSEIGLDDENIQKWLEMPREPFGGRTPIQVISDGDGAHLLSALRSAHG